MAHVRQELALVLAGRGELTRLLFERLTGLLDLAVLSLDFGVLVGKQPCLFTELRVRMLPALLLAL